MARNRASQIAYFECFSIYMQIYVKICQYLQAKKCKKCSYMYKYGLFLHLNAVICQKYAKICKENMPKYAKICILYAFICRNMQLKYAVICKNMDSFCIKMQLYVKNMQKYARKICQNMQKYAAPSRIYAEICISPHFVLFCIYMHSPLC
jgi:hypothetical protein